jgi:hypothetical protein
MRSHFSMIRELASLWGISMMLLGVMGRSLRSMVPLLLVQVKIQLLQWLVRILHSNLVDSAERYQKYKTFWIDEGADVFAHTHPLNRVDGVDLSGSRSDGERRERNGSE